MKIYYDNLEELKLKGVYLIRNLDNNLLKIGKCSNLQRRFKEIVKNFKFVGSEANIKIECFIEYKYNLELEKYLHKEFNSSRIQNEWFNIEDIKTIVEKSKKFKYEPNEIIKKTTRKRKLSIDEINHGLKYYKFEYKFDGIVYEIGFKSCFHKVDFKYLNTICYELGFSRQYGYFYEYYFDPYDEYDKIQECEELKDKFKNMDCDYIIKVNDDWISIKEFLKPIILNIKQKEINQIKTTLTNVINDLDSIDLNNYEDIKRVYNKMYDDIENQFYLEKQYYSKKYFHK